MVNRGLSYTLEGVIALSIVTLTIITVFTGFSAPQEQGLGTAADNGYSCLQGLDRENILREDAVNKDADSIRSKLNPCIRGAFNHTVQVCRGSCTTVDLDRDRDITSAKYYVAGHNGTQPALVIAYIWSII